MEEMIYQQDVNIDKNKSTETRRNLGELWKEVATEMKEFYKNYEQGNNFCAAAISRKSAERMWENYKDLFVNIFLKKQWNIPELSTEGITGKEICIRLSLDALTKRWEKNQNQLPVMSIDEIWNDQQENISRLSEKAKSLLWCLDSQRSTVVPKYFAQILQWIGCPKHAGSRNFEFAQNNALIDIFNEKVSSKENNYRKLKITINPFYVDSLTKTNGTKKADRIDRINLLFAGQNELNLLPQNNSKIRFSVSMSFIKFNELNVEKPAVLKKTREYNASFVISLWDEQPQIALEKQNKDQKNTEGDYDVQNSVFSLCGWGKKIQGIMGDNKNQIKIFGLAPKQISNADFNHPDSIENHIKDIGEFLFPNRNDGLPDLKINSSDLTPEAKDVLAKQQLDCWIQCSYSNTWSFRCDDKSLNSESDNEANDTIGVAISESIEPMKIAGKFLSFCLLEAILCDIAASSEGRPNSYFDPKLPTVKELRHPRPIDLLPFMMQKDLKAKGLFYDVSVLSSLAMALNSGDHIILTGPPGCGKTELATRLPEMVHKGFILCTASPDWTTNEQIGRYMPAIQNDDHTNTVLEFDPGFFLQAIKNQKWLIIDELNRADIDSCFGPLFSVLAKQSVALPYKEVIQNEETADEESNADEDAEEDCSCQMEVKQIDSEMDVDETQTADIDSAETSIADPIQKDSEEESDSEEMGNSPLLKRVKLTFEGDNNPENSDFSLYTVPKDFRIICTMNDSDAGMLNQLSYALQRRFSVIRIESPSYDTVVDHIKARVERKFSVYTGESELGRGMLISKNDLEEKLIGPLRMLFANKERDLLQLRVIGFGQLNNIIDMAIEGLSCASYYIFSAEIEDQDRKALVLTLLANGVVMKVFPQLPAFICNRDDSEDSDINTIFKPALGLIFDVFKDCSYMEIQGDERTLTVRQAGKKTLVDYLTSELHLLFRNQHVDWRKYWPGSKEYEGQSVEEAVAEQESHQ